MLTIVLVNWNRHGLLLKSLESFTRSKSKNFNVLIIDNGSETSFKVPVLPFEVQLLELKDKLKSKSFIAAHNYGFYYALRYINPDIIIMSHAEMYHQGDVISYAERVNTETYISFGCYSLGVGETPETVKMNQRTMTFDGDSAWYNHPEYRPRKTNFCSAITADNLRKLNGFDERFCEGAWYDDDYFLLQIERLGLKIELAVDPFVFHQNHPIAWNNKDHITINQKVFNTLQSEDSYRAKHIYTPDL